MRTVDRIIQTPIIDWLYRHRFMKFGTVGAMGVLVNLVVLFIAKEVLFAAVPWPRIRLNLSLALAIFCATVSNFIGNRHWTWRDRRQHHLGKPVYIQFAQYAMACWVGIALQVVFTNILANYLYYLAANLIAILLASAFNYLVNDQWTFRRKGDRENP